ncbi:hypothetical protein [Chitinimonas lacunae]|uniref:DUF4426 domain-containing protein n=1 Tax=Chitinimonas lacunae TaxID=1963018 RepID=A0ABV8MRN7_9NEIS
MNRHFPVRLSASLFGALLSVAGVTASSAERTVAYAELPVRLCLDQSLEQVQALTEGRLRASLTLRHNSPSPIFSPVFSLSLMEGEERRTLERFSMRADPPEAAQPQQFLIRLPALAPPTNTALCFELDSDAGSDWGSRTLNINLVWTAASS